MVNVFEQYHQLYQFAIIITNNYSKMQPKHNTRCHQLTPNPKPFSSLEVFHSNHTLQIFHSNPTVQPSKHPLDLSSRNRNLSLNDLKSNPMQNSILQNSIRQESQGGGVGREVKKLKGRVQQLQRQNRELYNLKIEYEEETKVWQEKARQLNEELINYQNKELQIKHTSNYDIQLREQLRLSEQKYINSMRNVQENNRLNVKRIQQLSSELDRYKKQSLRLIEVEMTFYHLQEDYQIVQKKFQREELKNKHNQEQISKLQEQISYLNQGINKKITFIQQERNIIDEQQKNQLMKQNKQINNQLTEYKQKFNEELLVRERIQYQNKTLKNEIVYFKQQQSKLSINIQQYSQQINALKRTNYQQEIRLQEQKVKNMVKQNTNKYQSSNISKLQQENHHLQSILSRKNIQLENLSIQINKTTDELYLLKRQKSQKQKLSSIQTSKIQQQQNTHHKKQLSKLLTFQEQLISQKKTLQIINQNNKQQLKQKQRCISNIKQQMQFKQRQYQRQKSRLMKQIDNDISSMANIVKEQQQKNYSLTAQNKQLHSNLSQIHNNYNNQIKLLQNRIQQYKQHSYSSGIMKVQIQKLSVKLQQQLSHTEQLKQRLIISQQNYNQSNTKITQLTMIIRELKCQMQQLQVQKQRWSMYRKSEEDDLRKQCRKYKKLVEQLQQDRNHINEIDTLHRRCQQLKHDKLIQQKQYNLQIQRQKQINRQLQQEKLKAMDQMQTQMKKILTQFNEKLIRREEQLSRLSIQKSMDLQQIKELSELQQQAKQYYSRYSTLQTQNQKLKQQIQNTKNQLSKIQIQIKKYELDNQSLKYSSQTQKDNIRTRYNKDMQQKVTEIQRLKLQISQLTQQLKKNITMKKQNEILIKNKEIQQKQSIQRYRYLQNMMETYQNQIKGLKILREKDCFQMKKIDDNRITLQRKLLQIEVLLNEQTKKERQLQLEINDLRRKYDLLSGQNNRIHNQLTSFTSQQINISKQLREKDMKINQLNQTLISANKYKPQIEDLKKKCEYLQERLTTSANQTTQISNLKQKCISLEQKNRSVLSLSQDLHRKIQLLSIDQTQKLHQIQILLQKISQLETQLKTSKSLIQPDYKSKRIQWYLSICKLDFFSNLGYKLYYQGDQQLFFKVLEETLRIISSRLNESLGEISQKKIIILELRQQKDRLYQKYMKYKGIALQYKQQKQYQKQLMRNNYRFQQETITHCQQIIKQAIIR